VDKFNPIVLIPARMASTRLPGKPLALIAGEAMIVHVWRRAMEAEIGPVAVAGAESEIAQAITRAGGQAILTRPDHPSGSDRIFEALKKLDPGGKHNVVVNVQGDLPLLDPAAIRAALSPLADPECDIATLCASLEPGEMELSSVVKVKVEFQPGKKIARALGFARKADPPAYHHIGLYAYRRNALERFVALAPSDAEKRENLEQLRALDAGMRIDVALVDAVPFGVDTPADLERARALFARGPAPKHPKAAKPS
jgi:3-deoxy-manno-octulosonate cytidylyltransferase (CMP-KDO synthetase)